MLTYAAVQPFLLDYVALDATITSWQFPWMTFLSSYPQLTAVAFLKPGDG